MELDLQSARIAREVEMQIKTALGRLPSVAAQKEILERIVVDVLVAMSAAMPSATEPPTTERPERPTTRVAVAKRPVGAVAAKNGDADGPRMWQRVLGHCISNPAPGGKFRTSDIADVLIPASMNPNRASAASTIYTAVKRKCKGEVSDFCFVWLGDGKFRLATSEEIEEAQSGQ